ncbi:UNVERIFIED_CONTAM: hypothetical protein H355_010507, partial [Colinus virginianus]
MERQQTDNLLKAHVSGTYLIRERPAEAERFAISIKFNEEVKHIKVVEKDNWIHITEAKKFESLLELVEYYQNHSLKESFKQLDTTLKYPYKSRERSTSRTFTRSPVFTPRVIGTAVARYNFAARDMRELSLREGDVVKIYSRIGGDQGWWKGETNGRLRPSDVEVELLAHTRDVVSRELPAETGLHTGWVQNGGLFIASNKQRLDEYKRLMS